MLRILADHNVEGHVDALVSICSSPEWADIWTALACQVDTFERLGLPDDTDDIELWQFCQERGIVLITGNRNADGATSLERTIRKFRNDQSLPVLTIRSAIRIDC